MRYARHFYALAKRITVEGGNQPRVKVANVIFYLFSQMVISQPLVNKIEWNKFHFVANLIAFKMNTNLNSDQTSILSWGWKSHCMFFFWHSLYISLILLRKWITSIIKYNHLQLRRLPIFGWVLVHIHIPTNPSSICCAG